MVKKVVDGRDKAALTAARVIRWIIAHGHSGVDMKSPAKPSPVYQLKVTLLGSKPPIWRRLLVPASITLSSLHGLLLCVMGWHGGHMHQFEGPDGTQYGAPEPELDYHVTDEARIRLDRVLHGAKQSMLYLYDFGDSWEHKVVVEKILPDADGLQVPICIGGARACPPDDCGGIWGYADFLEAVSNPKHPSHDDMIEWFGGEFDPEHFDPIEVNGQLAPPSSRKRLAR